MCDAEILKCAYIFYVTEATSKLTHSLKVAEAEKLSVEKKRLQTLQKVVSFADFVQREGDFFIHIVHGTVGWVAQSVWRLTTGWMVRDRIPVGMRCSARPDRPWGPPSLL